MSDLVERLQGAYSTVFERSMAKEAADEIIALRKRVGELERELAGWKRMMDEALNSGDGSYRP